MRQTIKNRIFFNRNHGQLRKELIKPYELYEKEKATHPSILAWRIPWTVQSLGLQRDMTELLSLSLSSIYLTHFSKCKITSFYIQTKIWQPFFVKGQIVSIFSFAGHMISISTQLQTVIRYIWLYSCTIFFCKNR